MRNRVFVPLLLLIAFVAGQAPAGAQMWSTERVETLREQAREQEEQWNHWVAEQNRQAQGRWYAEVRRQLNEQWFVEVRRQEAARASTSRYSINWDRRADCESGEWNANGVPIPGSADWHANTPPYYGGIQFSLSSWRAVGGTGYPHQHSREEQIRRGEMLRRTPPHDKHWPVCSRKGY